VRLTSFFPETGLLFEAKNLLRSGTVALSTSPDSTNALRGREGRREGERERGREGERERGREGEREREDKGKRQENRD
jgi:hypothetical protein